MSIKLTSSGKVALKEGKASCTCCGDTPSCPAPLLECISISASCSSPLCGEINPADGKRYTTVTTVHTDGHTSVTTYSLDAEGNCTSTTTCSGTVVRVTSGSGTLNNSFPAWIYDDGTPGEDTITETGSWSYTSTETKTYNADCSTTTTYSGSSSDGVETAYNGFVYNSFTCSSTRGPDGNWSGTYTDLITGETSALTEACGAGTALTTTVTPTPTAADVTTYTDEFVPEPCDLTFPSWPEWPSQSTTAYESGQGNYCGAFRDYSEDDSSKSERKAKWRLYHTPSSACYLKVWLKQIFTPAATEANPSPAPIETDLAPYVWSATTPCLADPDLPPDSLANRIYGSPNLETISENGSTEIVIVKYSCDPSYEPAAGQPNGLPPS